MNVLAIVGNGRTREGAPHDDPRYDVWMINNHALYAGKRFTEMFEMHPDVLEATRYKDEYKDWLRQPHDFPIYMHDKHPRIPASVEFPIDEIRGTYGRNIFIGQKEVTDHYSSTFPYALALGIFRGYPRIELHGIDLDDGPKYDEYKKCVFFWLGIASALKIKILFPAQSKLIIPSLYPFY